MKWKDRIVEIRRSYFPEGPGVAVGSIVDNIWWKFDAVARAIPVDLYFPTMRLQGRQREYYKGEWYWDKQVWELADFYRKGVMVENLSPYTPGAGGEAIARYLIKMTGKPALYVMKFLVPLYDLAREGVIESHWIDPTNGDTSVIDDVKAAVGKAADIAGDTFGMIPGLVKFAAVVAAIWVLAPRLLTAKVMRKTSVAK